MNRQDQKTVDSRRRRLFVGMSASVVAGGAFSWIGHSYAADEPWPSRPVTVVVPFPAGGSVDALTRLYTDGMSQTLGVPVIVDNRTGASGVIGTTFAARARPDGYTLISASQSTHVATPLVLPNLAYDSVRDFAPIALLGYQPNLLVVNASIPAATFSELLAFGKANPGKLNYGSSGPGSLSSLNFDLLKALSGLDAFQVPYRGGAPMTNDLLGGQIHLAFENLVSLLPHVRSGKLRPLGLAFPSRWPDIPAVPTFKELGIPQFNLSSWGGLAAPTGTPVSVMQRLVEAVHLALRRPGMDQRMRQSGIAPPESPSGPAEFTQLIAQRLQIYGDVVRHAGISATK